jgi:hypothetical protein
MDVRFSLHNIHHEDVAKFALHDPQLRNLKNQFYVFTSGLIKQIPLDVPGIYSVGGEGRSVKQLCLNNG